MKKLSFFLITAVLISSLACNRDEDTLEPSENTQTSEDYTLADALFENVSDVSDQAADNNEDYFESGGKLHSGMTYLGTCVNISFDSALSSTENRITIDFGNVGCTGQDGRTRRGIVIVEYDGRYRDSGTVITTTFDNYFVDDYQLLGTRTVSNKGKNNEGQTYFEIVVNGTVITPDDEDITYISNRTRTWVEGEGTSILIPWLDDVYEITGSASGINRNGLNFEVDITNPIVIKLTCPWAIQGTYELRPDQLQVRTVDFGDGECDAKANLTVGNFSIDFLMR